MDFPGEGVLVGVPHTPGTREYLTCESGTLELVTVGSVWTLEARDVLVFRGDQKHTYRNKGDKPLVAFSIVVLAPGAFERAGGPARPLTGRPRAAAGRARRAARAAWPGWPGRWWAPCAPGASARR
ncbi:cupin domain-containing protein [Cystobacter fuscus]